MRERGVEISLPRRRCQSARVSARRGPGCALTAALVALVALPRAASAEPAPRPYEHLADNAWRGFVAPGLIFHGAAVALTVGLSAGGLDHRVRVEVQRGVEGSAAAGSLSRGAVVGGYVLPALIAPGVYAAGLLAQRAGAARAGAAAVQALVLTVGATFALKALTGRPFPLNGGDPRAPDRLQHPEYARQWGPPSLDRVAWPSGHTSAGFALASSLTYALPGRWWVPAVSYPVAVALGVGMVVGDHHWASDVVAGALLGQAVGSAVGQGFARPAAGEPARSVWVTPVPRADGGGLAAVGVW